MGVRDRGTRDQAVGITNLHAMYKSGPRGIHVVEVKKRLMSSVSSDDDFK